MKSIVAVVLCVAAMAAQAHDEKPRVGVVSLDAQASAEVPFDVATVTLGYEAEDRDPAQLTQRLNQVLDDTMKQAKQVGAVNARSGGYRTYPMTDKEGRISTWRGRSEIVLESRDFSALSALAGRLSARMPVAGINFALAPETRRAEEDRLVAEAIARFQSRAQIAAKSLGYSRYTLVQLAVGSSPQIPPAPRAMMRSAAGAEAVAAPVPIEAGRATVSVTVNGSVQLEK